VRLNSSSSSSSSPAVTPTVVAATPQFSRMSYFYFLVQACLTYWPNVSPFDPWGTTIALGFVLFVAAVKTAAGKAGTLRGRGGVFTY
jgi:hypothetical protein